MAFTMQKQKKLINAIYHIHNFTSPIEKSFAGQFSTVLLPPIYANVLGIQHYSINSLLYLKTVKEKYVLMYKEFIAQLHIYTTAIRTLVKGYQHISLITPLKLKEILNVVRTKVRKTNLNYDLVINRLYLYYDMKLVTLV